MIVTLPAIRPDPALRLRQWPSSSRAFSFWFQRAAAGLLHGGETCCRRQVIITARCTSCTCASTCRRGISESGLRPTTRTSGLIAIHVAFQTGFCTFVLSNYMKTIPRELGRGRRAFDRRRPVIRQYLGIILPLCKPALAALATLEFTWIYKRLPVGGRAHELGRQSGRSPPSLTNLQGVFFTDNNLIAAASVLVRAADPARVTRRCSASSSADSRSGANKGGDEGRRSSARAAFVFTKKTCSATSLPSPELRDVEISLHDQSTRDRLATGRGDGPATSPPPAGRGPHDQRAPRPARPPSRVADFVLNMVQIGGPIGATAARLRDPRRATGLRQTIADTLGNRGHLPHPAHRGSTLLALGARAIAELAPGAWLLNYTNPMAMLVLARVRRYGRHANVVGPLPLGAVHEYRGTLAALVGVPARGGDVSSRRGVNHQAFILRFEQDGERISTRGSMRANRKRPGAASGASAWPLHRPASATSPTEVERATRPSTCRGSCDTRTRSITYRIPIDEYIPPQRAETSWSTHASRSRLGARRCDADRALETSTPR